ncbi:MAG TPA: nicotinate-nicotinamide nucleotide adenylyltransferase [Blastocatellia bacterium]|nr:nicotinate-nicotinamide nucleotide adenylyltransferase [Blastocatellia bacterium]
MERSDLSSIIERASLSKKPEIYFVTRAEPRVTIGENAAEGKSADPSHPSRRLGIFSGSFNPVTTAHVELVRAASRQFRLDEILALVGTSNADKRRYEAPLEDRLQMLILALTAESALELPGEEHSQMDERSSPNLNCPAISIGICTTAFFVDMADAVLSVYPSGTDLYFVMGVDTFVRVLDSEGKYLEKYQRRFSTARLALEYLLSKARLIVAERVYPGCQGARQMLLHHTQVWADRILFMNFPLDLSEQSATKVREAIRQGCSIDGLVPAVVAEYIRVQKLYA